MSPVTKAASWAMPRSEDLNKVCPFVRKDRPFLNMISQATQKKALKIARQTLEQYLNGKGIVPYQPQNAKLNDKLGCFTTLRTKCDHQLRGCIGQFEPDKPLWQVIQETAIAAATQDYRFPPVTAAELPYLSIEISVMTPKKKIDDWRKIKLGKHGVVIQNGIHAGTFLPQVATETGWDLETFLGELCTQKAGLPQECYKNQKTELFIFEVTIISES